MWSSPRKSVHLFKLDFVRITLYKEAIGMGRMRYTAEQVIRHLR